MKIGIPKETKDREYRVGLVPDGASALCQAGHEVLVERDDAFTAPGLIELAKLLEHEVRDVQGARDACRRLSRLTRFLLRPARQV